MHRGRRPLPTHKICVDCKVEKEISEYLVVSKGWYRSSRCKPCDRAKNRKYHHDNRERSATRNRVNALARFGLTQELYDALLEKQGGVCAICFQSNTDTRLLAIDHDHSCCPGKGSCGKCVRGLLCGPCNLGIGSLKDSKELVSNAYKYLEEWDDRSS